MFDPSVPRRERISAGSPRLVGEDDDEEVENADSDSGVGVRLPGRLVAHDPCSRSQADRMIEDILA